jgi:hypothetical protein
LAVASSRAGTGHHVKLTGDSLGDRDWLLVLPEAKHSPPFIGQSHIDGVIARDVAGELGSPVGSVASGLCPVDRASMPEAAVDEDREAPPRERNVDPDKALLRPDREILSEP